MTPRASLCPAISRSSARCSRWSSPSFTPHPSLVVPRLRFYGPVRVMPSLGTGELPYPLLEAAIFPGGRGVAPHDLRGQPEALALQALYLPAHLLWPHAALLCGQDIVDHLGTLVGHRMHKRRCGERWEMRTARPRCTPGLPLCLGDPSPRPLAWLRASCG